MTETTAGARESLFASQVPEYAKEKLLGTDRTGAQDNYSTTAPMYRQIQRLASVVNANPALKDGAQVTRYVDEGQGVFAMSRTDAAKGVEYVVAVNNGWSDKQVKIPTYSRDMAFTQLYPAGSQTQYTDIDKKLTVTVPHMSVIVFKAAKPVAKSSAAPSITLDGTDARRHRHRPMADQSPHIKTRAAVTTRSPSSPKSETRPGPPSAPTTTPTGRSGSTRRAFQREHPSRSAPSSLTTTATAGSAMVSSK
ncbi:MAG: hypothetical protein R2742_02195 [Micropruina glycogenica]